MLSAARNLIRYGLRWSLLFCRELWADWSNSKGKFEELFLGTNTIDPSAACCRVQSYGENGLPSGSLSDYRQKWFSLESKKINVFFNKTIPHLPEIYACTVVRICSVLFVFPISRSLSHDEAFVFYPSSVWLHRLSSWFDLIYAFYNFAQQPIEIKKSSIKAIPVLNLKYAWNSYFVFPSSSNISN